MISCRRRQLHVAQFQYHVMRQLQYLEKHEKVTKFTWGRKTLVDLDSDKVNYTKMYFAMTFTSQTDLRRLELVKVS